MYATNLQAPRMTPIKPAGMAPRPTLQPTQAPAAQPPRPVMSRPQMFARAIRGAMR